MTNTTHELTEHDSKAVDLGRMAPGMALAGVIITIGMIVMTFASGANKQLMLGSYRFGFIFWIGIYPVSFTGKTEASVRALITQVQTKAAATVALAAR